MADVTIPKIAVSLGGQSRKSLPSNNPLKRSRASLGDDDEDGHHAKVQNVSHFDHKAGGAIDKNAPKAKGPLVIRPQSNRDWKEAGKQRRQRSVLPGTEDTSQRIASIEEAERKEKDRSFGLNIMKPVESVNDETLAESNMSIDDQPVTTEKTLDEQAMDALLGLEKQSTLVVPAVTETDAFQSDYKSAPDMASLADYERVPVEEFGAAMLRGMGWKDGEGFNKGTRAKKTEAPQRRPALLGIGAKSDAAIDGELGGWGKAARGKEIKIYNPVLLKDKKTGELFTEAELQQKKEDAQRLVYEQEFEEQERAKEKHRRERDGRGSSRDRDRRRDRDDWDDDRRSSKRDDRDRRRDDDRRDADRRSSKRDDRDRRRYDDDRRYDSDRRVRESDPRATISARESDDRRRRSRERSSDRRRDRRH